MNENIEKNLKRMAKGWFVLRLSNDLLNSNYDLYTGLTEDSIETREKQYKNLKPIAYEILLDIKNKKDKKVRFEVLGLNNVDILKIVDELLSLINKNKLILITDKNNKKDVKTKLNYLSFGDDKDGPYIRYASNVLGVEKVPGLVAYLENEYEKIVSFGAKYSTDCYRIPVILSKEMPAETYRNSDDIKARRIKRLIDRYGRNVSKKMIEKILIDNEKKYRIAGMYSKDCNNMRCIYIYYKNISCSNLNEYHSILSQTLSHEYMHYIHDINSRLFNNNDEDSICVKEALADFFSILFLSHTQNSHNSHLTVANDRYGAWSNEFGSSWPYAEALWFYYIDATIHQFKNIFVDLMRFHMIEKFKRVLQISRASMKYAYNELQS